MSKVADYVMSLNRRGVRLWVDDGQLRYHAKKGALSAEELTRLRAMRSEILAELSGSVSAADAPLTFQQRWLLQLIENHPDWKATLSHTYHLRGELDSTALERSIAGILRKHASLRTRMVRVGDEWCQRIEPSDIFRLPIVPVSRGAAAEKERELDRTVAPLVSAKLVRVGPREHFLVLVFHRLATDCLGIGHSLRDLWSFYGEAKQKRSLTDLEGSAGYRDYALGQQTTDGAWRQKHAAYWTEYLAGAEGIAWPVENHVQPAARNSPGVLASLESSFEELSSGLRELGRQTQTLPALVMLTLYVACMSLWCGQKDLVVPFQVAGRAAAHEGIVGCFAHIVYLRIRLTGTESFLQLLKRVSNEFYRVAAFRQDSGRMVLERPELLRGAFCQWLSWHPADVAGSQIDGHAYDLGLEVEKIRCQPLEELTNVPPDRVDLEINFFEAAGNISALAIYRTDRFAAPSLARLMGDLRSAAARAVRDSHAPLAG